MGKITITITDHENEGDVSVVVNDHGGDPGPEVIATHDIIMMPCAAPRS